MKPYGWRKKDTGCCEGHDKHNKIHGPGAVRSAKRRARAEGKKVAKKVTGARFCWLCSKKLRLPYFTEHVTEGGHTVKVHKQCKENLNTKFEKEFDGDRRGFWLEDE